MIRLIGAGGGIDPRVSMLKILNRSDCSVGYLRLLHETHCTCNQYVFHCDLLP